MRCSHTLFVCERHRHVRVCECVRNMIVLSTSSVCSTLVYSSSHPPLPSPATATLIDANVDVDSDNPTAVQHCVVCCTRPVRCCSVTDCYRSFVGSALCPLVCGSLRFFYARRFKDSSYSRHVTFYIMLYKRFTNTV